MASNDTHVDDRSRRSFVRTAVYTTPFILTLRAEPAFASHGSGTHTSGGDTTVQSTSSRHAVLRSLFKKHDTPGGSGGFLRHLVNRLLGKQG